MSVIITGTSGVTYPDGVLQPTASIGVGQTWQNVIGSRSSGTTYTNSTGRPIMVTAAPNISGFTVVCAGITLISTGNNAGFSFIVPDSTTYSITGTINSWVELR